MCEACAESAGPLEPLLLEVGNRVQDKKASVRSAARSNLCALCRNRKHTPTPPPDPKLKTPNPKPQTSTQP